MNSNQNGVILVKGILVIWFLIDLIYNLDWLQTLKIIQFSQYKNSISSPTWRVFFTLIIGFRFMQFDP
jgi:hypothetical protein